VEAVEQSEVVWRAADPPAIARVRSTNPAIATAIRIGTMWSATFKGLVDTIDASNGLVYVEAGTRRQCHDARACLLPTVAMAGPNRMLRVLIDHPATGMTRTSSDQSVTNCSTPWRRSATPG
jgi:hypothetical protein